MAVSKYGENDWFAGWRIAIGDGEGWLSGVVLTDSTGAELGTAGNPLVVSAGGGMTAQQVQGNVASGATDAGNPVKVGYVANSSTPATATSGQRVDAWGSVHGAAIVGAVALSGADGVSNTIRGFPSNSSAAGAPLAVADYVFNGATFDRMRGDVNGIWVASFTPTHITTSTTTVVKGTPGVLHSVIVNTKGTIASTITVYNNTTATGTVVAVIDSLNLSGTFIFDITMSIGITVVTTGTVAPDVTVAWR